MYITQIFSMIQIQTHNNIIVYFKILQPSIIHGALKIAIPDMAQLYGHNGLTKSNKTNRSFCCKSQSCNSLSFYSFIRNHLVDRSAGAEQYFARDLLIFD